MSIYFLTGNPGKLAEAQAILPQIESLDLDLPEIQEINAQKIIEAKIQAAFFHQSGEFIVEDTSLYFYGLNGLPGPLIRWFEDTIGNAGLYKIAQAFDVQEAVAKTIVGYAKDPKNIHFFEGSINGTIVKPKNGEGFGFDFIFQPHGYRQTFSEMGPKSKNEISMRKIAFTKLAKFLSK